MKELKVFIIEGCEVCKRLVKLLGFRGLIYSIIDADLREDLVTPIEDALGTSRYPIVKLTRDHKILFCYLTDDDSSLGEEFLQDNLYSKGFSSLDQMVDFLVNTSAK